jgi:integrase/recombinase XerD
MLHFEEKGGKSREIPVRHDLEGLIAEYIDAAGLREAPKDTPLFQSALKKKRRLSGKAIHVNDICRMMKRRLKDFAMPLLYSRILSASPPSPTYWSRTCPGRTCST